MPDILRFLLIFAFPLLLAALAVEAVFGEPKEPRADEDDYPGPF